MLEKQDFKKINDDIEDLIMTTDGSEKDVNRLLYILKNEFVNKLTKNDLVIDVRKKDNEAVNSITVRVKTIYDNPQEFPYLPQNLMNVSYDEMNGFFIYNHPTYTFMNIEYTYLGCITEIENNLIRQIHRFLWLQALKDVSLEQFSSIEIENILLNADSYDEEYIRKLLNISKEYPNCD